MGTCARLPLDQVSEDTAAEGCEVKCTRVCVGDDCHCEPFELAEEDALCLPIKKCKAACDAEKLCSGFEMPEDGLCYLHTCGPDDVWQGAVPYPHNETLFVNASRVNDKVHDWYARAYGKVCTTPGEYTQMAGYVAVTERLRLGGTFVIEANKAASLEVAAKAGQTVAGEFGASKDRISVVDMNGVCVLSPPSE
jgi:hypothetical protein